MLVDYPMGSKCAGYTAPRKFTRATFRVNSNVTGYHFLSRTHTHHSQNSLSLIFTPSHRYESMAIVELITNYKIGTQKVITISGLSGFKAKSQGSVAEVLSLSRALSLSHTSSLHQSSTRNRATSENCTRNRAISE